MLAARFVLVGAVLAGPLLAANVIRGRIPRAPRTACILADGVTVIVSGTSSDAEELRSGFIQSRTSSMTGWREPAPS
jgi:hypothetical protein